MFERLDVSCLVSNKEISVGNGPLLNKSSASASPQYNRLMLTRVRVTTVECSKRLELNLGQDRTWNVEQTREDKKQGCRNCSLPAPVWEIDWIDNQMQDIDNRSDRLIDDPTWCCFERKSREREERLTRVGVTDTLGRLLHSSSLTDPLPHSYRVLGILMSISITRCKLDNLLLLPTIYQSLPSKQH